MNIQSIPFGITIRVYYNIDTKIGENPYMEDVVNLAKRTA